MLGKEHIRQASTEKVAKFTDEVFVLVMKHINESSGYLNDTEMVMSAILLSDKVISACENIIGEEGVTMILEHLSSTKEKDYGNEDN